ncbi:hypothetical protein MRS44_005110 [Fusarium solani]|uniref:uncharacterized protein n=1 Tax=Fusarium solani TaxID=169388 RepID=UPI0032C3DDCA|nr:hypothetical protein MRS44_005110 [Fusarium solani]
MEEQQNHADKNVHFDDSAALEQLGHKQELQRNFSKVSLLGLAFAILNTWTALSASISLALPSGGPSAVIWGLMVAGICNLCLAAPLAEFLSAYPTAGGQYHWSALISWPRWSRGISYVTGWINAAGYVILTATAPLLGSTFVIDTISFMHPTYESKAWHQFLIYLGFTFIALFINAFANRLLPLFNKAAFLWSISGFVIISITVLACASPNYQSGGFVYGKFINEVGWPDGLSWLLGLLQGAFALTGFDAAAHMIEEIPNARKEGPRIMIWCILIGMASGFIFLSCLLFVLKDVQTVIESPAGALLQIYFDATNSKAGSVCLIVFSIVCMVFTATAIMTTSARMTYAFARDRGLPFSNVWAVVHPTLDVPLNALLWTTAWVIIFGLILLGSSSAFNAITAASVSLMPSPLHPPLPRRKHASRGPTFQTQHPRQMGLQLGRYCLGHPHHRPLRLPPELPVTPTNMNYCIAAFGIILLIAVVTWIVDGRKNYKGPLIEMNQDGATLEGASMADTTCTSNAEDDMKGH